MNWDDVARGAALFGQSLEAVASLSAALNKAKGRRRVDGRKQRLEFVMDVDEMTDTLNALRVPVEELLEIVASVERHRVEGEAGNRFQSVEID